MFSCLQILEAFLWFVLITLLNVTLIILTLSVSRLLNLLLRLVAFLLFLNPQCLASISRWITASSSWKRDRKSGSAGMPRPISYAVFCLKKKKTDDLVLAKEHGRTRQPRALSRSEAHGSHGCGVRLESDSEGAAG